MPNGMCHTCGREWNGHAEAHCRSCHLHFVSDSGFARHRTGPDDARRCMTVDELAKPRGKREKPTLVPIVRHGAAYWVSEARNLTVSPVVAAE